MREIATKYPGIRARHHDGCGALAASRCNCGARSVIARVSITGTRKVKSKTHPTVGAALAWKLATESQAAAGGLPSETTVRAAAGEFLAALESGTALTKRRRPASKNTVRDIEGAMRLHVLPRIGDRPMRAVTRGDMHRLVDGLSAQGLSPSRVHSVVAAAGSLWRWSIDRDLADVSPTVGLRLPQATARRPLPPHTPEQVADLVRLVPAKDRAAWALWAWQGLRRSEVMHLAWQDVDMEHRTVKIRQGKSDAAARTLPLAAPAFAVLREHWMREGRPTSGPVMRPLRASSSGVWAADRAGLRARKAWEAENATRVKRGQPELVDVTPHQLRHLCATWLHQAGVSLAVRAHWLGHSRRQLGMTEGVYTHVVPADLIAAARALERIVEDPGGRLVSHRVAH
jgi:integrase